MLQQIHLQHRLLPGHGANQLKTEAALLEPAVPAAAQGHGRGEVKGLDHKVLLEGRKSDYLP